MGTLRGVGSRQTHDEFDSIKGGSDTFEVPSMRPPEFSFGLGSQEHNLNIRITRIAQRKLVTQGPRPVALRNRAVVALDHLAAPSAIGQDKIGHWFLLIPRSNSAWRARLISSPPARKIE